MSDDPAAEGKLSVEAAARRAVDVPPGQRMTIGRYRLDWIGSLPRIICRDAPNIDIIFERGRVFSPRLVRHMPRGSIFVDGACSGPPFYDNRRRHYSLDHHEGCLRPFTLAACEQAAVVLHQGMPLVEGSWSIHVNAIDADALLASWLLVNHEALLADERRLLVEAMPLVRVEGAIDAQGLGAALLTGLPEETRLVHEEKLAEVSRFARQSSSMPTHEAAALFAKLLSMFDDYLIPREIMGQLLSYEELGRVKLSDGQLAIAVRSEFGIYETEAYYKARLAGALGILVLCQDRGLYSVRLVNQFMKQDLGALYAWLNRNDPAVLRHQGEAINAWGGSGSIGGSPRETGSELGAAEILAAIDHVYGSSSSLWGRLKSAFHHKA